MLNGRPLEGVRVVEVTLWGFVPSAAAILADWGATVLKIEHPEHGDPMRGLVTSGLMPGGAGVNFMWEFNNRNKRGVGIDLAQPEGREALYKLVEGADVFLTSFLPDARRRLGIDVDDIVRVNPRIIYARGSGQGPRGPDAEKGGYDGASFWARGGPAMGATRDGASEVVGQPGPQFGDSLSGGMIAGGIAAALFNRERSGEGSVVDVSLLGTAMWAMAPGIMASALLGIDRMPMGSRGNAPNPGVLTYRTSDGRFVSLVLLQPDRYWADFCQRIGRPDLATDLRFADATERAKHNQECINILDQVFGSHPLAHWKQALADFEGVWAVPQTVRELHDDPQAIANEYLRDVTTQEGTTFTMVAWPMQFNLTPPDFQRAPDVGEHTDEELLAAGYTWDELVELKVKGAIT